jgi:hypothetical protein
MKHADIKTFPVTILIKTHKLHKTQNCHKGLLVCKTVYFV